jgi:hypothetical protein
VSVIFAEIGQFVPKEFMDDRTRMMPGRDFAEIPKLAPHAREQLRAYVATMDAQLADGRAFLLGDAFSLADAATFHPLWFLRVAPQAKSTIDAAPHVARWMERLDAMGHGERTPMTPDEALASARDATPAARGRRAHHGHARRLRVRSGRRRAGVGVGARGRAAARRSGARRDRRALSAHRLPRGARRLTQTTAARAVD